MGTNFYMMTKNKKLAEKMTNGQYNIVDEPYFCYSIHIGKRSMGWLPLFQGYKNGIKSVKEYKKAYDTGECEIYNEYMEKLSWEEFDEEFLKFNGGKLGVQKPEKVTRVKDPFQDYSMPDYIPVSHLRGSKQSYNYRFMEDTAEMFADEEGYEFDYREFS